MTATSYRTQAIVSKNWMTGIDHPVIAVRDMTAAHAAYERLGFTIPPRGSHIEWGTGNWCIMFPDNYLELRGIINAGYTHNLEEFLQQRGEGLMGLALGTIDAEASRRALVERGFQPQPVRGLARNFELPEGWLQPRFSLCFLDAAETGGLMSVVFCQHLTPELLRRPEWLEHANGASAVRSMTGTIHDVELAAETHARLFDADAVTRDGERLTIETGRGQLVLGTPQEICRQYPECSEPASNRGAGLIVVTLETQDVQQARRWMVSRGVAHRMGVDDAVIVAPHEACGVVLEFVGS